MFINPLQPGPNAWDGQLQSLGSSLMGNSNSNSNSRNLLSIDTSAVDYPYLHFVSPDVKESLFDGDDSTFSLQFIRSLLLSPRIKDGHVQSARGLLLSYVCDTNDSSVWDKTIGDACCEREQFRSETVSTQSTFQINIAPQFPKGLLPPLFIYSTFAIYKDIVFSDTRCIRSKVGLVIAQIVQILLAIFSSATITSLLYPQFCLSNLYSFVSLPLIVISGSIENMLELINTVSRTRPEISPITRVASSIDLAFPKSIKLKLSTCLLLSIVLLANFSQLINSVFIFTILGILIDLALHMTYFTAVLSVDLYRLELDDLLSNPQQEENSLANNTKNQQYSNRLKGFRLRAFLYLNYLNPRQRFPVVMTFIVVLYILLTFGYGTSPASTFASESRNILFINQLLPPTTATPLITFNPIVLSYDDRLKCFHFSPSLSTTASIMGGYSIFIFIEFIASLSFILSISSLILKILLPKRDYNETNNLLLFPLDKDKFSSKDLVGYHTLDVIQIIVNRSWIATVSLDHGICVWNIKNDATGNNKQHNCKFRTLPSRLWPVSKVLLDGVSSVLVITSCSNSIIEAWDFTQNKIMYSIKEEEILSTNHQPFLSFILGRETVVITRSGTFLMISDKGTVETVCPDLTFGRDIELIAADLLITPKLNAKVVCLFSDNSVIVVTHIISKQWNFRSLELLESSAEGAGAGTGTGTGTGTGPSGAPTILYRPYPSYPPIEIAEASSSSFLISSPIPRTRPMKLTEKAHTIIPVPTIHMVLLVTELTGLLFDVHTGVIVRHFQLGLYKPGTLRVFHAHPTHCRFCGCASIQSISIAYNDQEDKGLVICHTMQIENRAKNNICLRVERDPRETRCLGFEAATENLHWIDRVEGWDATDINMMMGVRRKEAPRTSFDSSSSSTSTPESGRMTPPPGERELTRTSVFRRITNKLNQSERIDTTNTGSTASSTSSAPIKSKRQKKPPLNITWEGWAMTGLGEVSYYDIPDVAGKPGSYSIPYKAQDTLSDETTSSRLLIRTVGPTVKYGKKSIAVAFGNVIKILYFGTEEFHDEGYANRLVGTRSFDFSTNATTSTAGGGRRWKREVGY